MGPFAAPLIQGMEFRDKTIELALKDSRIRDALKKILKVSDVPGVIIDVRQILSDADRNQAATIPTKSSEEGGKPTKTVGGATHAEGAMSAMGAKSVPEEVVDAEVVDESDDSVKIQPSDAPKPE